jgi:hypothetical protein
MPDIDTWTPADDALVRSALASLRAETDTLPLADPRVIRARGAGRRRRTRLGWAAGAAAAVVVAATVGYAALGRDGARPVPPAVTTATAPAPTSTGPEGLLATASPLPLGAEWQRALGLAAAPVVQPQPAYEGNLCQTPEPGSRRETQRVVGRAAQPDATLLGVQTRYSFVSDAAARAGMTTLAQGIASCTAPVSPRERTTSSAAAHQRIWSYTKDGATGWLALAQYGTSVAWLEVSADAPEAAAVDQADMATIAGIAYQRLRLYGAPATPKPGITTPPPRAVDEDMPVTGPQPALSSSLFVAATQWASPVLTGGQRAYAGPGDPEGSSTVVQCETDQKMTTAGRYGIVSVRSGPGDANYIGKQRVRLFEGADAVDEVTTERQRVDDIVMAGCGVPGGSTTTATRGPTAGTYLLTTVTGTDASGTLFQWVGVSTMATPGAISTIAFHGTSDGQGFTGTPAQGFAELDRLLALARQK